MYLPNGDHAALHATEGVTGRWQMHAPPKGEGPVIGCCLEGESQSKVDSPFCILMICRVSTTDPE